MRNRLFYDKWVFEDRAVTDGSLSKEVSLLSSVLAADTLTVGVKCSDPSIINFVKNAPLRYFYRNVQKGIYYLQSIERTGPNRYTLSGLSAVSLLSSMTHNGGVYTGQTVEEVVHNICSGVPVYVKTSLRQIALYGWLPIAAARDNLSQVLFAIGVSLGTDLDGILRVEPLWDGLASTVATNRMHLGGSVAYGGSVTAVSITEHQYSPGSEEKELFKGNAQSGDVITFGEPMHSLTAAGFDILESGANWARVSAGSGTLTGKTYIHTTRQVTEAVSPASAENVQTVKDATLVSLVNSRAVAKRLAEYYRCTETIKNPIVTGSEKPGHVVSIYHPYDKVMVPACIASADITMSATLKSDITALVGFRPPQPDDAEYYDERIVLTGEGVWTAQEGITSVRYVLIGSGDGGSRGTDGGDGGIVRLYYRGPGTQSAGPGKGGKGGEEGLGGLAGRILEGTIDLAPGAQIAYHAYPGGLAGQEPGEAGQPGQDTTFGGLSSASGTRPDSGYIDGITGEVYGIKGADGIAGGDGGDGAGGSGTGQKGGDVGEWTGGTGNEGRTHKLKDPGAEEPYGSFTEGGGGGSGAVYGSNGRNAVVTQTGQGDQASSADGVDALPLPANSAYGNGGPGGNGGSGGGGQGQLSMTMEIDRTFVGAPLYGKGGKASIARDGSPGCVILYYRRKITRKSGPVVSRDGKWMVDRLGRRFIV